MTILDELIEVIGKASTEDRGPIECDLSPEQIKAIADAILERFCVGNTHHICDPFVSHWHSKCKTSCGKCMDCGRTRREQPEEE